MYRNRIILVDDDPDYAYLVEEAFKECIPSCQLTVINSGADLLSWLENNLRPNLILLDIYMSCFTGIDILKLIKSVDKYKTIPVVMLSVSKNREDIVASYMHGANAYIAKPIEYTDLVPRLKLFAHYWFDTVSIL